MLMTQPSQISIDMLRQRLDDGSSLDNVDPHNGFALVSAREPHRHGKEHIPDSINIDPGDLRLFQQTFGHKKEIVLYGDGPADSNVQNAARELINRGYLNIFVLQEGLEGWKQRGLAVVSGQESVSPMGL